MDYRKNRRERFLQDGREAWNEYIATGKYITAEAAEAWLARLQFCEDIPPPESE